MDVFEDNLEDIYNSRTFCLFEDIEKLKNDLNEKNIRMEIEKNRLIAKGFNINGTPTLIIGDKIIPGAINEQQLNELIKEARDLNS